MPFTFPLQAVLHLRQSLEHQQELRLRAANQQVARVRHLLEQIDLHRERLQLLQGNDLTAGTTAAEMRFGLVCDGEILRHRRELEQQLLRLQQLRDQQRAGDFSAGAVGAGDARKRSQPAVVPLSEAGGAARAKKCGRFVFVAAVLPAAWLKFAGEWIHLAQLLLLQRSDLPSAKSGIP
jgi:hypothetical protein